jgi:hypothetical protein
MAFISGARVEVASGGSISSIGGHIVHTFSSVGVNTFIPTTTGTIEVLLVGAGGSSSPAGAGGGGSVILNKFVPVIAGVAYTVSVGSSCTLFHPVLTLTAPAGGNGETHNPLGCSGGFSGPEGTQTISSNTFGYGFSGGRGDIIQASGGNVTVDGVYKVHVLTTGPTYSGGVLGTGISTFTCTAGPGLMDYLLVGAGGFAGPGTNVGGSASRSGGGGGGGSVIYTANGPFLTSYNTGISHTLTASPVSPRLSNTYTFRGVVAPGGAQGAEGSPEYSPPQMAAENNPLGSGGGGSWRAPTGGLGADVSGLGFPGTTNPASYLRGSSGGGAGGPAGLGLFYSISGVSSYYGAGGTPYQNTGPTSLPIPTFYSSFGQGGAPGNPSSSHGMATMPGVLIVRYYADGKKGGGGGAAGAAVTTTGGAGLIYKIDGTSRCYGGGGGYTLDPQSSPTDYGLGNYEGTGNPGIVIIRYPS